MNYMNCMNQNLANVLQLDILLQKNQLCCSVQLLLVLYMPLYCSSIVKIKSLPTTDINYTVKSSTVHLSFLISFESIFNIELLTNYNIKCVFCPMNSIFYIKFLSLFNISFHFLFKQHAYTFSYGCKKGFWK